VKWQTTVSRVCDIVSTLDRAFHIAKSGVPGPVFVELPIDILYPDAVIRKEVLKPYADKTDLASRLTRFYINRYLSSTYGGCESLHASAPIAGARVCVDACV
jgi:acetolactate synthase-like protein